MITADIIGSRLGNAMFQVAAAYSLSLDHKEACAFEFDRARNKKYLANVFRGLNPLSQSWKPKHRYTDMKFDYTPIQFNRDLLLKGFFQSEKYFINHREEIIHLFRDEKTIESISGEFENSVSIHVRRDDYLLHPTLYPILGVDYYQMSLDFIESQSKVDHIYVFSDDLYWCRKNFDDSRIKFMALPDYLDMYMMAKCTHNIIANSSFSWWGSYLNTNKNKIVCAPKQWIFGDSPDIYYEGVNII